MNGQSSLIWCTLICLYALSPAPPLTVENILKALEGVKNWGGVASCLGTYGGRSSSLKEIVEKFLQGRSRFQPSWRAVIFAHDMAEKTPVASRIRSYGEPIQGRYTYTHLHKKCIYSHHTHGMCTIIIVQGAAPYTYRMYGQVKFFITCSHRRKFYGNVSCYLQCFPVAVEPVLGP